MKDMKSITCNGRAAFYASVWPDLRQSAMNCGWALALHGSLASDMDIMAMPWVEGAVSADEMVRNLIKSFGFSEYWMKYMMQVDRTSKPNGRVVYTIPIYSDFYIDLNVIER